MKEVERKYNLDSIKFGVDQATFERAISLYENGKIKKFKDDGFGYSAIVQGGSMYEVYVSKKAYDQGTCSCYLGKEDILCKHMVAVALYAVLEGKPLSSQEKTVISSPTPSRNRGELDKNELRETKATISHALRYIKPYNGPSRTWFAYQNSLQEGCNRLSAIFSELPISVQTAKLVVLTLLKLDNRLSNGGVDDSDGTVGTFIEAAVDMLEEYQIIDPSCARAFAVLENRETCFGWEERLIPKKAREQKKDILWQSIRDTDRGPFIWNDNLGKIESAQVFAPNISIGTGLGGKGQMLRYALVLTPLPDTGIAQSEKKILASAIQQMTSTKRCLCEKYTTTKQYTLLIILIDIDTTVDEVSKSLIDFCNKKKKFLRSHYFVTNTTIPTKREITQYLEEVKDYHSTTWD